MNDLMPKCLTKKDIKELNKKFPKLPKNQDLIDTYIVLTLNIVLILTLILMIIFMLNTCGGVLY